MNDKPIQAKQIESKTNFFQQLQMLFSAKPLTFLLLVAGVLIRLIPFLFNRSLWYDEALLANNILNLSFGQLTGILPNNQAAPIGFLWAENLSVMTLGTSEYALRLFPFCCSIFSLYLFYKLADQVLKYPFVQIALAFFVFGSPIVYYATEVKQYSCDLTFALLVLVTTFSLLKSKIEQKTFFCYAGLGIISIWFSQPVIFILAGAYLSLLYFHSKNKNYKYLRSLVWVGGCWALSFSLYFFLFLKPAISNPNLQNYHNQYFMPFAFWEPINWKWYFETFTGIIRTTAGIFFKYLAAPFALAGIVVFFKQKTEILLLFIVPVILTFIASGLHLYSTIPRLLLFLSPIVILFVVKGLEMTYLFFETKQRLSFAKYLVWLISGILLLQPFLNTAIHDMANPKEVEAIKSTMRFIEKNKKPGDTLVLYPHAIPQYTYYKHRFDFDGLDVLEVPLENVNSITEKLAKHDRIWLLFSHYKEWSGDLGDVEYLKVFDRKGKQIMKKQAVRSVCYLYSEFGAF